MEILNIRKTEKKLLKLMAEIHLECFNMDTQFNSAWFFPPYNGVKGFLGTDKTVIVALNPSYGKFPSRGDIFLYKCMKEYGFENAHLTDIIKHKLTGSEYTKLKKNSQLFNQILEENVRWLKREITILAGDVKIVAIGKEAYDILNKYFKKNLVNIVLPHYSWVERYAKSGRIKKRLRFKKVFNAIKKRIEY
jgi:hypothetical protein